MRLEPDRDQVSGWFTGHHRGEASWRSEASPLDALELMDPFVTMIVGIVLVFSGIWGTMILKALLQRRSPNLQPPSDDPRIGELLEDKQLLEERMERVEEELAFFRELRDPKASAQLPRAGKDPL